MLWASPICTEISPAGGRERTRGQLELLEYGSIPDAAWERTRATAYEVIRYTEIHRPKIIVCENVVEFATDWELFDWWRTGIEKLGYTSQVVSVSAAHIGGDGNAHAPQWRDRIYIVYSRTGIPMRTIRPRPLAWCPDCDEDTNAVQTWRSGRTIGKYRQQYDYRCANTRCMHTIVEPYIRPAASIIDWSNIGTRIGDRKRPLVPNTLARIQHGLDAMQGQRTILTLNHSGHTGRSFAADAAPLPTRSTKIGEGILTPFVVEYRHNGEAAPVDSPLATVTAGGNHHGLVSPFLIKNYGGNCSPANNLVPTSGPTSSITANDHHALVVPYRKGTAKPTNEPLLTLATKDSAAVVRTAVSVEDCYFRMVQPPEQMAAQRFPTDYIVMGNKGEQTAQAGNAVACNVAQWLGGFAAEALGGRGT